MSVKNSRDYSENLFIVNGDLEPLLRRLKKGMRIRTRVVWVFGGNRYLLRIHGYNLLMESRMSFNRFEEVDLVISEVRPRLVLEVYDEWRHAGRFVKKDNGTDLIV